MKKISATHHYSIWLLLVITQQIIPFDLPITTIPTRDHLAEIWQKMVDQQDTATVLHELERELLNRGLYEAAAIVREISQGLTKGN